MPRSPSEPVVPDPKAKDGATELPFSTADVARLAGTAARAVRDMVRAGYLPARKRRARLCFGFQDVVLARAATRLQAAGVPARRIGAALRAIRAQWPAQGTVAALSIRAEGDQVVVTQAGQVREPHSGQYLLSLDVTSEASQPRFREPPRSPQSPACEAEFLRALTLEESDPEGAIAAYRRCVAAGHLGARTNLGRLLHEQGRVEEAVRTYRASLAQDGILLFNWAVALEDLRDYEGAVATYERALRESPDLADAHYNLSRLAERLGDRPKALRHLLAYRRLTRDG